MTGRIFVDANMFVYARDLGEPTKQPLAGEWLERLWQEQRGRTSTQALNEFYYTVTRKLKPGLTVEEAWDDVRSLLSWNPQPVDTSLLLRAREIEQRYRLSWWDSLIVGAAQLQECSVLLTEDLQDRSSYGGVTVRNPFVLGVSEEMATYAVAPAVASRHRPRGRPRRSSP
jgi:predicted nucleic acid-binding protein